MLDALPSENTAGLPQNAPSFLTPKQVAELLQVSETTVYTAANQGHLRKFQATPRVLFRREEVEKWAMNRDLASVPPDDLLSAEDAGKLVGRNASTIACHARRGNIPSYGTRRTPLVSRKDVLSLYEEKPVSAGYVSRQAARELTTYSDAHIGHLASSGKVRTELYRIPDSAGRLRDHLAYDRNHLLSYARTNGHLSAEGRQAYEAMQKDAASATPAAKAAKGPMMAISEVAKMADVHPRVAYTAVYAGELKSTPSARKDRKHDVAKDEAERWAKHMATLPLLDQSFMTGAADAYCTTARGAEKKPRHMTIGQVRDLLPPKVRSAYRYSVMRRIIMGGELENVALKDGTEERKYLVRETDAYLWAFRVLSRGAEWRKEHIATVNPPRENYEAEMLREELKGRDSLIADLEDKLEALRDKRERELQGASDALTDNRRALGVARREMDQYQKDVSAYHAKITEEVANQRDALHEARGLHAELYHQYMDQQAILAQQTGELMRVTGEHRSLQVAFDTQQDAIATLTRDKQALQAELDRKKEWWKFWA